MNEAMPADPAQSLLEIPLERGLSAPSLQRQLHLRLRQAIFEGLLASGSRLPSSRTLSGRLLISRNTVTAVYEQLAAEGYVQSNRQGTIVTTLSRPSNSAHTDSQPSLARRVSHIQPTTPICGEPALLRPGVPDLIHFPIASWRRSLERVFRTAGPTTLNYGNPFGEPRLRASIAHHLAISRGVRCRAEQIIITEGAQEAISLCVLLFTNPGDTAWVEDPGYRGSKVAMFAGDLRVVPKRVDEEGLINDKNDWKHAPRLIYTTPSHQYPTGSVLSVSRRLELLASAREAGAWIIEDDYDSEFRHAGQPIGAMQGLLDNSPVLYVGTFSKNMFPALRIGFIVLPSNVLSAANEKLAEMLRGGQRHNQLALADFMESGQFSRHLRRMRRLYRDRQHALRAALDQHFAIPHYVEGGQCGLHLTVRMPPEYPDVQIAAAAKAYGLAPSPLSKFSLNPLAGDNGLVLGYGTTSADLMNSIAQQLTKISISIKGK